MRPDHKKGREAHYEMHKVMDDRAQGKITNQQCRNDLRTLKGDINREVINPIKGYRE